MTKFNFIYVVVEYFKLTAGKIGNEIKIKKLK